MHPDRPVLGVAFMLGFCVTIPFADAFAKIAGATLPLAMLVGARCAVQAAVLTPLVRAGGGSLVLPRRFFWLAVLNAALNLVGLASIYGAFRFLPLADAIAIAYVMPFMLLFLGRFLMGEEVGARRVAAAAIGFLGTLMVVQPSFAEVGLPALLPLVAAVAYALYILVTRIIARSADPLALQALSGWLGLSMLVPLVAAGSLAGIADLSLAAPSTREIWLLAGVGGFGTLAHLLMAWSLRHAPSATVAPVQYLEIPVAACVGWVFFRQFPNGLALVGILVILTAGLYIVLRERALSRAQGRLAIRPADHGAE